MKNTLAIGMLTAFGAAAASADVIPDRATLDALLGGAQVLEDFESFDIGVGGAVVLDTGSLDSLTIANGQGPGLVEPGATYADPSGGALQWNGDTYFDLDTKTLLANSSAGTITIDYDAPMRAVGLDLLGFIGFDWSGTVDVYSDSGLLGSIPVSIASGGAERVFAGWEDVGGITHVEISSSNYSWSPIIDDHGYGVPTPSTLAALGVFGLAASRRRR